MKPDNPRRAQVVATYNLPGFETAVVAIGPACAATQKDGGWQRLSAPGDKCGAHWRHEASGWQVRHCGHPTANWPYYAIDPAHEECATVSANGRGFRSLKAAFAAVESVIDGRNTTAKHARFDTRIITDGGQND